LQSDQDTLGGVRAASSPGHAAPAAPKTGASARRTVPRHVAVVMDGNGRWAKSRFMPRFVGHKHGVDALVRTVQAAADRGIEYLTVFAFSSENWKRPDEEVSGLMNLVLVAVAKYLKKLADEGVRIHIVGDRSAVNDRVRQAWDQTEATTRNNTRIVLSVAFNYGGRWDVVQACQRLVAQGVAPEGVTEDALSSHMAMNHAPDPDLFIRTGGEVRISNFLLWQAAYSELYFTNCLWPDFDERELDAAIAAYASRDRRYGGVKLDGGSALGR
jgi:undecaprenyl diphosphate synthase